MFSSNLKFLMKKFSYTSELLAQSLKVNIIEVQEWENGLTPPIEIAMELSKLFSVSLHDMMSRDLAGGDWVDTNGKTERLLEAFEWLSPESRIALINEAEEYRDFKPVINKNDKRYERAVIIAQEYIESLKNGTQPVY